MFNTKKMDRTHSIHLFQKVYSILLCQFKCVIIDIEIY